MPNFFINKPKPGKPLSLRGLAQGLLNMERAWQTLDVLNGHIEWDKFRPIIVMDKYEEALTGAGAPRELDVTASGPDLVVQPGEFVQGVRHIEFAGETISGSAVSSGQQRWVYLSFNAASGVVSAAITADEHKPVDSTSGAVYKLSLSLWEKTTDSWLLVRLSNPLCEQHGIDTP